MILQTFSAPEKVTGHAGHTRVENAMLIARKSYRLRGIILLSTISKSSKSEDSDGQEKKSGEVDREVYDQMQNTYKDANTGCDSQNDREERPQGTSALFLAIEINENIRQV
jgi:hypothetical protein